jgi:LPS sulfotransferase NodH
MAKTVLKGVAVLTEGRSGSNWLASLTNATGVMGRSAEWLNSSYLGFDPRDYETLEQTVVQKGTTENGRFSIKVFPRHLLWSKAKFGKDLLFEMRKRYDLSFVILERRDRLRQAISFYRARMSGVWTSRHKGEQASLAYDFAEISRAYFQIEQSYAFWRAYLSLPELGSLQFVYEELQDDPNPYVQAVAALLDVEAPEVRPVSSLRIQRDGVTEEWTARFREDAAKRGAIEVLADAPVPRTFGNLVRFAQKRPLATKKF